MNDQLAFDYQREIERFKKKFGFDFVALALVQPAAARFVLKWVYGAGNRSDRYKRLVLQTGKGVAGTVFKTGKPMLVTHAETTLVKEDLFNYPIVVAEGLKSFGALPLYQDNRVKGVLLAAYRTGGKMTPETFLAFKQAVGPSFGSYDHKEMVK